LQCGEAFEVENVIPILPFSADDIKQLETRIAKLKESDLTHSLKKAPGSKKKRKNAETGAEENGKESNGTTNGTKATGIKNAATASLTAKVLGEQEARNKKRKLEKNENIKSLFSNRDQTAKMSNSSDYMTRGYALPNKEK
jgi:Rtf2 RING-finger